ncbi:hypothetical protein Dda_9377 [Drechslerella dactyloides]|uniref:Uncharacterized protein n=1 Tax=Drechslerella dactyloides TaxID=74499 RepID=A0AAD6IPD4_DREDA|nr:hypothetical protein Dda_9377 [Drechslerella dactyloides]
MSASEGVRPGHRRHYGCIPENDPYSSDSSLKKRLRKIGWKVGFTEKSTHEDEPTVHVPMTEDALRKSSEDAGVSRASMQG